MLSIISSQKCSIIHLVISFVSDRRKPYVCDVFCDKGMNFPFNTTGNAFFETDLC